MDKKDIKLKASLSCNPMDVLSDKINQPVVDFVDDMKNSGFLAILNKKKEK